MNNDFTTSDLIFLLSNKLLRLVMSTSPYSGSLQDPWSRMIKKKISLMRVINDVKISFPSRTFMILSNLLNNKKKSLKTLLPCINFTYFANLELRIFS